MAPRSFEHQIYITLSRTGHRMAFMSRGLIGCFISHLEGISNFCAIYSFTGILFTVRFAILYYLMCSSAFLKIIEERDGYNDRLICTISTPCRGQPPHHFVFPLLFHLNYFVILQPLWRIMQAFVGLMIKNQPLYIKGIDESNQELTKESAFGAMGMFMFIFTASVIYLCYLRYHKRYDGSEHAIRSQGYMRPGSASGMRMSDYQVELPHSAFEIRHSLGENYEAQ